MKLILTLDLDNPHFAGRRAAEAAKVLFELAAGLARGSDADTFPGNNGAALADDDSTLARIVISREDDEDLPWAIGIALRAIGVDSAIAEAPEEPEGGIFQ